MRGRAAFRQGSTGWYDRPIVVRAALLLTLVVGAVTIFALGDGLYFFRDEWYFIMYRHGHSADVLLSSHAGHLSVAPVVIYKTLFRVGGLGPENYWLYRGASLAILLCAALLLFVNVQRRVAGLAGVFAVAVVLFLGPGWMAILFPFMMSFLGSIAAGLGMLLVLEGHSRRADVLASALLALSLSFSAIGIAFAVGASVEVLLHRDRRRRAWLIALPLLAFFLWYIYYGRDQSQPDDVAMAAVLAYVYDAAGAATGVLLGLDMRIGRLVALALIAAVVWRVAHARDRPPQRLLVALAMCLTFWTSLALTRSTQLGGEPNQSRYLFPGAVFVLLVLIELVDGWRPSGWQTALLGALTLVVLVSNIPDLVRAAGDLRADTAAITVELRALQLTRGAVDPYFSLEMISNGAAPVLAGWYFDAIDRYGGAGDAPDEIAKQLERSRELADEVLVSAYELRIERTRPRPEPAHGTAPGVGKDCAAAAQWRARHVLDLTFRPGRAVDLEARANAPIEVVVRRFADRSSLVVGRLAQGLTNTLSLPADHARQPWRVRLRGNGPFKVCWRVAAD